jgi:hypothetical protein
MQAAPPFGSPESRLDVHYRKLSNLSHPDLIPKLIDLANYLPDIPSNIIAVVCEREEVYEPRQAEESIFYGVIAEKLAAYKSAGQLLAVWQI